MDDYSALRAAEQDSVIKFRGSLIQVQKAYRILGLLS